MAGANKPLKEQERPATRSVHQSVFLVGLGIGDIVSTTKQASTHAVALITYPNAQE